MNRLPRTAFALSLLLALPLSEPSTVLAQSPAAECDFQGTWEARAPLPILAVEASSAAIGSRVYVLGGYLPSGASSNRLFIYDALRDVWGEGAPLPIPEGVHSANFAAFDGKLYVLGGLSHLGQPIGQTFEYDPAANLWTQRAPMPTKRGAAGVAIENRIYVAGGLTDGGSVATLKSFDPFTNTWQSQPPMPTPRDHLTASIVCVRFFTISCLEYKLFAIGGRTNGVDTGANEAFDFAAHTWSAAAPLPTPRSGISSAGTSFRGALWVFGGEHSPGTDALGQNESFGAAGGGPGQWCRDTPLPTPRHGFQAAAVRLSGSDPAPIFAISGGLQPGKGSFSNVNEAFYPFPNGTPSITANGVVNAASYSTDLSPGGIASVFGRFFYYEQFIRPRPPLPTRLNSLQVLVNGQPASLLYAGGTQINFIIPRNTVSPAIIVVNKANSLSREQVTVSLSPAAPAIFSADGSGRGQGAILHAGTAQLADGAHPARANDPLEIYLTGLNVCEPDELCTEDVPQVTVGGRAAPLLFYGNAPGLPGLNQINIRVPDGAGPGAAVPVSVVRLGNASNEVTIAVQ